MISGELIATAERLRAERVPFVSATVVRAVKPTSVRPGDSAIVHSDGTIDGFVGGQCAETSVRLYSARVLETGDAVLLRLVPGTGGDSDEEGVVVSHNPCLSGGSLEIFLEPQVPAARIAIAGDTPIARALVEVARSAGYDVGPEPHAGDAAVVVASHGHDEEVTLEAALTAGVPYVGLVASPKRGEAVRASLDLDDALRARLHTPAGLDIGARGPAEIAISILAQIVAERTSMPSLTVAIDPVCGMEVAVGPHAITAEGHYFCREGCRDAFLAQRA